MPHSEHYRLFQTDILGEGEDYYKPVRIITVASGKSGTGKTNMVLNLAAALTEQGKQVVVFNTDTTKNNFTKAVGVESPHILNDVWTGKSSIRDILLEGPEGISVLPSSQDLKDIFSLDEEQQNLIINAFLRMNDDIDVLLIDAPPGISDMTLHLMQAAHESIVVINDEPASIADGSVLIKLLNNRYSMQNFRVMVNKVDDYQQALHAFESLELIVNHQYALNLEYIGAVVNDGKLKQAHESGSSVIGTYPYSDIAFSFRGIAESINYWPLPFEDEVNLIGFLERLMLKKC